MRGVEESVPGWTMAPVKDSLLVIFSLICSEEVWLIFHLFKIEPGGGWAGVGGVTPQPASEAETRSEYAMRCCEPGPA